MFELPEYLNLSKQINATLAGKTIQNGQLGNKPHKFVWYNRTHEEFTELTRNKKIGNAYAKGKWLLIPVEPDYVLAFGECGGKMLFHSANEKLPKTYHLALNFDDSTALTATTQMWGAMELFKQGDELKREYIKDMALTPVEPDFTSDYFNQLVDSLVPGKKRSVKSLLTQEQTIPGLGNAIAQDILFNARLHPRHPISELTPAQRQNLYNAIIQTIQEAINLGGRHDEYDLFNQPGKYIRLMDKKTAGHPCPACGTKIEKIQYLGGACYFCPVCQK